MFPTYDEPSALPFGAPSSDTHRVYTTATRPVTDNLRYGCFGAGRPTPFVGRAGYYRAAPMGVNTGRLPSAMDVCDDMHYFPRQARQERMDVDVPRLFRRNYKRPGQYEPCDVAAKKFRQETGNGHIHCETENTRTCGIDQMHDPSSSLYLNTTGHNQSYFLPADKSSSISDPGCKYISSNNSKSNKSDTEYERMLFETHGCSIYHHQQIQSLDNDHVETEF